MNKELDEHTGLPIDRTYLEYNLPEFLHNSILEMKEVWTLIDAGDRPISWDCSYCELQSNINIAEVEGIITSEQAWYLREKYLRMRREN